MINKLLVEHIKNNDSETIRKIYEENRLPFFTISNRYKLENEKALDIYQDSIIALIENCKAGKLDNLQASIKTYHIGICKIMIFNYYKQKHIQLETYDLPAEIPEEHILVHEELTVHEVILKKAFKNLGEQCRKILTLFYYQEQKLDDIMNTLHYDNKDVLKSQKSRCLSHLKKMMQTR